MAEVKRYVRVKVKELKDEEKKAKKANKAEETRKGSRKRR